MSSGKKTLGPWLSLGKAADYIGVHFTTLRRWADDGKVPCIRTPGRRRRFKKEELDLFMDSLRQGQSRALATSESGTSIPVVVTGHMGMRDEPWYDRLQESQRNAMRSGGQRLMAVLMQYATRNEGREAFLEEGRRLAAQYGEMCHAAELSLVETVRAFTLVRRSVSDAVYQAGSLVGPPDAETWRIYECTNHFLDSMLLTIVEGYDSS